MASTVQLNTRIDPEVKRQGDAVFARAQLSSSEVVRALWQVAAESQQVPECILQMVAPDKGGRLEAIERGAGVAIRVSEELGARFEKPCAPLDYDALCDGMYDEMIEHMEATHA